MHEVAPQAWRTPDADTATRELGNSVASGASGELNKPIQGTRLHGLSLWVACDFEEPRAPKPREANPGRGLSGFRCRRGYVLDLSAGSRSMRVQPFQPRSFRSAINRSTDGSDSAMAASSRSTRPLSNPSPCTFRLPAFAALVSSRSRLSATSTICESSADESHAPPFSGASWRQLVREVNEEITCWKLPRTSMGRPASHPYSPPAASEAGTSPCPADRSLPTLLSTTAFTAAIRNFRTRSEALASVLAASVSLRTSTL